MFRTFVIAAAQLVGRSPLPHSVYRVPLTQLGNSSASNDIFVAVTLLFAESVETIKDAPSAAGILSKKIILTISNQESHAFSVR